MTVFVAAGLGFVVAMLWLGGEFAAFSLRAILSALAGGGLATVVAMAIAGALVVLAVRHLVFGSVIGWASVIGALIWVPFGNHILAVAPGIETTYPGLRPRLETMLSDNPLLADLRRAVEAELPPPAPRPSVAEPGQPVLPATAELPPRAERPKRLETPDGDTELPTLPPADEVQAASQPNDRFRPVVGRLPQIRE
ncbi:MAG: hypothetical protein AAGI50_09435 [Pseudomonadota bacterium]